MTEKEFIELTEKYLCKIRNFIVISPSHSNTSSFIRKRNRLMKT